VIEPDGHAAGGKKNGNSVTDDQCTRMIHLESLATSQLNGENAKGLTLPKTVKDLIEVFRGHIAILRREGSFIDKVIVS